MSKSPFNHPQSSHLNIHSLTPGVSDHAKSLLDEGTDGSGSGGLFSPRLDSSSFNSPDYFGTVVSNFNDAFNSSHPVLTLYSSDVTIPPGHAPDVISAAGSHSNLSSGGTATTAGSTLVTNTSNAGLTINLSWDSSVNSAPAGFTSVVQKVAQYFASEFTDPVTVNISVGYGEVGGQSLGGALGSSLTYLQSSSYTEIKNALTADKTTAADGSAVASLLGDPTNGGNFWIPTAEAKAMGLLTPTTATDGFVGFSSSSGIFDYDNTNGVASGQYDLFGVVAHEFSEVMGRMLLVGGTIGNTSNSYDPLDLFHYSASATHDLAGSTPGYFSINNGATSLNTFNTVAGGDAGDWKGTTTDAFNAFGTPGVVEPISTADITALDAIGWNAVTSSPPPSTNVIEAYGSTSLVSIGSNFFLYPVGGSSGPELQYNGAPFVAGQFGVWTPIGAEQTASGYEVAWKNPGANQYTVWNTNSAGNYISDIGIVSGTNTAFTSLEASFHQDLNGDGVIGSSTPGKVIEAFGSTSLVSIGSNFFLYPVGGSSGPELQYNGAPFVAGQFGVWTPIGAEQTASGYEVAWKNPGANQYTVWNTNSAGNYISDIGIVSGTNTTLISLESSFHQDLNGDGVIGPNTPGTVIEAFGSTSLVSIGSNYFLYPVGGSSGPELQYNGAAFVAGQFGAWTPIGAEQTASGYEVAWKNPGANQYTVWNTNSAGNYISDIGIVSGTNTTLISLESSFHQDLNGNGVIGLSAVTGGTATELVDQHAPGAPLVMEGTPNGQIATLGNHVAAPFDNVANFTSNSDVLDFSHLAFGDHLATGGANTGVLDPTHFVSNSDGHASGTQAQFIYNTTSHVLSFDSDGTSGATAIQMAKLENSVHLTFSDIHLV